jgi:hypothetical protein
MHSRIGQHQLVRRGGIKALNAVRVQQGSDMQMEATKEGTDITGDVDGAWSLDVLLKLRDLTYDSMGWGIWKSAGCHYRGDNGHHAYPTQ